MSKQTSPAKTGAAGTSTADPGSDQAAPGNPSMPSDDTRPFGSDPTRSKLPLYLWGVLYGIWAVALLVMAFR